MGTKKRNKLVGIPWRQDFRDVKTLPDLKIVRTHFLFNLLAGLFFLIVLGLFSYQEYVISVRSVTVVGSERTVSESSVADKRNQADSARFMRDVGKVVEAAVFADTPVRPELLVAELARVQLPQGRYESMDFTRNVDAKAEVPKVFYRLLLSGTVAPDQTHSAPVLIDIFVETLRKMPIWQDVEHNVELISSEPERDLNYFKYSMKLEWSSAKTEDKAK